MPKLVFLAGPYQGASHDHRSYVAIDAHINAAREAAIWCARHGLHYFCPHLHSAHFEVICPEVPPAFWYALGLRFLEICDGILLLDGWRHSAGATAEAARMQALGRPTFAFPGDCPALLAWNGGVP